MNKEIELLNKKLEAQDKIINTQVLEIARLKSNYNFVEMQFSKMTKEDVLKALTSKCEECERLFNSYDRVTAKYQNVKYRIDKAIEYIKLNIRDIDYDTEEYDYLMNILEGKDE